MRTLATVVTLVFALALSSVASAQTTNVKNPFKATFCFDGKDDGGTPVVGAVQVLVKIDGAAQTLQALPAPVTSATCPAGTSLYTVSGYSASKANHTATGAGVSSDGVGIDSDPFDFTVSGRPPSKFLQFKITQ